MLIWGEGWQSCCLQCQKGAGWAPELGHGGPAASQAALWGSQKFETFWGGTVKSGIGRHDNDNPVYLNRSGRESESSKLTGYPSVYKSAVPQNEFHVALHLHGGPSKMRWVLRRGEDVKGWGSEFTQEHSKGFTNLTRGLLRLWCECHLLIKIVKAFFRYYINEG